MRKMGAARVVIERLEIQNDQELKKELDALSRYFGVDGLEHQISRLTFIRPSVNDLEEILTVDDKDFLASSTIINVLTPGDYWISYMWEAVVVLPHIYSASVEPPTLPMLNNYYHVNNSFQRTVCVKQSVRRFDIKGTFFCQQNGLTSVCAHAALQTMVNNARPITSSTFRSEHINEILEIDHTQTKIGKGLSIDQVQEVLTREPQSFNIKTFDFIHPKPGETLPDDANYIEVLHHLIESKCPCLLTFTTRSVDTSHVVCVLGHTLNSDSWHPEARLGYGAEHSPLGYVSAAQWIDHFLINDDQYGMCFCLAVNTLRTDSEPCDDLTFRAGQIVAIVPETSFSIDPDQAQILAVRQTIKLLAGLQEINPELFNLGSWLGEIWNHRTTPWVTRTALLSKLRYRNHISCLDIDNDPRHRDYLGNVFSSDQIDWVVGRLPEYFWLSEISLPDIYTANKNKLIDVVVRKDPIDGDEITADDVVFIRLPGLGVFCSNSDRMELDITSHYPLFRVDPDLPTLEW